jgi:hypothetical protein
MVRDISRQSLGLLAVAAIVVSMLGTFLVLSELDDIKQVPLQAFDSRSSGELSVRIVSSEARTGESAGLVSLNIARSGLLEDDTNA